MLPARVLFLLLYSRWTQLPLFKAALPVRVLSLEEVRRIPKAPFEETVLSERVLAREPGRSIPHQLLEATLRDSVLLAVENQAAGGQVYNAADVVALSLKQIVEMVGEIMAHKWEIIPVPRELMPAAPQSQGLPYSCDPCDIEPHLLLDLTKIRSELGYHDLVPITKAMENTVKWLVDNPPSVAWLSIDYPAQDEAIRRSQQITRL